MKAVLMLENGTALPGESFGSPGETTGEIVFNTSMTGYQEILTDPSYFGQVVTMTYPLIGNTGVNPDDLEAARAHAPGLVVREYCDVPSNFRSTESLDSWLKRFNVVAIQGIDTRMVTRMIRSAGAMRCIISTLDSDEQSLMRKVAASPQMAGRDLTREVSCRTPYEWSTADRTPFALRAATGQPSGNGRQWHVVVYDYGVKHNILRRLASYGCRLTVVPCDFPSDAALAMNPDGIFLSNGPGDPAAARYAVENVGRLIGEVPVFGICLGHQLLALALGGRTFKLKFGHRGANHPVKNLLTGGIEITSQNHGFAVDADSFGPQVEVTHVNLNDGTNEGLRHRDLPVFSVQYHPEASPGPHDGDYLFRNFTRMMQEHSTVPA